MARDAICIDKVSAKRLLLDAIATGDHAAWLWIMSEFGDECRQVISLSGHEPDAMDRILSFCADHHLLTEKEIVDFAVWNTRQKLRGGQGRPIQPAKGQMPPLTVI